MTKMCKTCMAREADPSEYHDDACPVFQEQAAYRVGFDAGRRAGVEAALRHAKVTTDLAELVEARLPALLPAAPKEGAP